MLKALELVWVLLALASFFSVDGGRLPDAAWLILLLAATGGVDWVLSHRTARAELIVWLQRHRFSIAILALCLLALALQLNGLFVDLGQAPLDVDENRLASTSREFFISGTVPHETVEDYPGIYYWLLVAVHLGGYLGQLMAGTVTSFDSLPREWLVGSGRLLNAFLYGATVAVAALAGRHVVDRRYRDAAAWTIAGLLAISPLGIRISTQFRNEAALLLLCTLALLGALEHLAGRRWALVAAGVAAGLAAGVKYTGVFALLPVLGAALLSRRDRGKALALGSAAFAMALLVSNPFLWLDFSNFIEQLGVEVRMTGAQHWSATSDPAWFYTAALARSFGAPLVVLAAVSMARGLMSPLPAMRLVLALVIPYQLFMTHQPAQFERWVYVLVPGFAILGVAGLAWMLAQVRRVARNAPGTAVRVVLGVLLAVTMVPPAYSGVRLAARRWRPSTYELAERWLDEHATKRDLIAAGVGWLRLDESRHRVERLADLKELFDEHSFRRSAYAWIVVPEPLVADVSVVDREPAASFHADYGIGGNAGFDLLILQGPEPEHRYVSDLDVLGTRANRYLGREWRRPGPNGYEIPGNGRVFLPLNPDARSELQLDLVSADESDLSLALWLGGTSLPVECERGGTVVASSMQAATDTAASALPAGSPEPTSRTRWACRASVERGVAGSRPSIVRVGGAADASMRLAGFRVVTGPR